MPSALKPKPTIALVALIATLACALSAQAHPRGAVRLPGRSLARVGHVLCGRVHGRWVPGAMVSRGWFLSDSAEAHGYAVRARHARGRARRTDLARSRSLARTARREAAACSRAGARGAVSHSSWTPAPAAPIQAPAPATPAPAPAGARTYVPPSFLGQHMMFNSTLNPAFPVRAMRLWDSNTQWCQMDAGTASGEYDFTQLDAVLAQASRLGADAEFTFGYTPQWAATGSYPQPSATGQCAAGSSSLPPADESYWTNFVTALVTHAAGRIHAYELWNEADYAPYWSGDVGTMVRMSVDAAAIIHRLDPSALVLSPSITDTSEGYSFLREYLSELPPGTIDAIAVHSYTFGAWPEQSVPAELAAVRAALPAGYAGTPIWSTEGGWGMNSQFSSSASDQRAFVARYDLQMLAQGVARSYWYAYPNTQWGGLWDGSALTPAGVASAAVGSWLAGATFSGCATADGNLWTCSLVTPGGRSGRIVWATRTPVAGYSTAGFSTVDTLSGGSSAAPGSITVTGEPVLLTS